MHKIDILCNIYKNNLTEFAKIYKFNQCSVMRHICCIYAAYFSENAVKITLFHRFSALLRPWSVLIFHRRDVLQMIDHRQCIGRDLCNMHKWSVFRYRWYNSPCLLLHNSVDDCKGAERSFGWILRMTKRWAFRCHSECSGCHSERSEES